MRLAAPLAGLAAAAALGGCGQKGPLYLPDHKPQAVTPATPAAAPAPAASPAPAPESPPAPAAPDTPPKKNQDDGSAPQ